MVPRCVMCNCPTLVQSDDCLVYQPVVIEGRHLWIMRQALVMWCRTCDFVGEVQADIQNEVRKVVPHFEVKS